MSNLFTEMSINKAPILSNILFESVMAIVVLVQCPNVRPSGVAVARLVCLSPTAPVSSRAPNSMVSSLLLRLPMVLTRPSCYWTT